MAKGKNPSNAASLVEVLRLPDPWAFLDGLTDLVAPPGTGFTSLGERPGLARMILLLRALYLDVDNEGIWEFLMGETGAHVPEAREWCTRIGARRAAAYLDAATAEFPDRRVPEDEVTRADHVMALGDRSPDPLRELDKAFKGAVDEMAESLRTYLGSHIAELESVIAIANAEGRRG